MTRNQLENRRQGCRNRIVETVSQEEFGEVCRKNRSRRKWNFSRGVSGGNSIRDEVGEDRGGYRVRKFGIL